MKKDIDQPAPSKQKAFDFLSHLKRQREWSEKTFGPGKRTAGVCDHIRKELSEIEADPEDISEWIDVAILALDGAWRAGYQPQQVIDALVAKQTKNENRTWPDWRTMPADKAIEHDRSNESSPQPTESKLQKPAKVGGGIFHAGISERLVIEAAQRNYEYNDEDAKLTKDERQQRERYRRELWDNIHGSPI